MKVALVEMTSLPKLNVNLKTIVNSIRISSKNNADMVVFPENCSCLGPSSIMLKNAEIEADHPVLCAASLAAKKYGIYVLLGSIAVFRSKANKNKMQNRSILVDRKGKVIARYNKINMFDAKISDKEVYRESNRYTPGKKVVVANTEFGKIGLSICYDLRFPNMYKILSEKGANIITIPSAFTITTGRAHWEILLRARAIENSCWILAPAQVGTHYGKRSTWGHSMIVDPWGKIVIENKGNQGIIYGDIDINKSEKIKNIF